MGFDPVEKMKGANFVIGYVKEGREGRLFMRDASGSEKNGVTEIRFTIPLDSGDPKDRPLQPGERHVVIFSYGKKDDFSTPHSIESEAKGTVDL